MKLLAIFLTVAVALSLTSPQNAHAGADQGKRSKVSLAEFDHLDPNGVVPERPLRQALTYFKMNRSRFPNQNYLGVIDYTQPASSERMYIINLKSGAVSRHATAHGQGSDPSHSGRARYFSNRDSSHATSLGFYRTGEVYNGKHGRSLRLDGLSPSNSNARRRAVVIHAANYVRDGGNTAAGRSFGCPAVDPRVLNRVISQVKGGALIYAWAGN